MSARVLITRILCTHPGKAGDILWALPTMRYLAEAYNTQVDFWTSAAYKHVLPLVEAQPYVRHAEHLDSWEVQDTAPMSPWIPPAEVLEHFPEYDHVYHLGYHRWPVLPLAFEVAETAGIPREQWEKPEFLRPWITLPPRVPCGIEPFDLSIGFTDEWFELKFGIACLVQHYADAAGGVLCAEGSRWHREAERPPCDLLEAAHRIEASRLFLGCLSSLAVIAAGLGKPRVLVEPNPNRHHPIFQHPDRGLVLGADGKPTFDARHVVEAVKENLWGALRG